MGRNIMLRLHAAAMFLLTWPASPLRYSLRRGTQRLPEIRTATLQER